MKVGTPGAGQVGWNRGSTGLSSLAGDGGFFIADFGLRILDCRLRAVVRHGTGSHISSPFVHFVRFVRFVASCFRGSTVGGWD